MRSIVIGAGPIGGIIGGLLARKGNDVTIVDVDADHVQAIREHGLQVDVPDGSFCVSLPTTFPNEIEGKFDIGFIAVRSFSTRDAVKTLYPHLADDSVVVSLQNGINMPLIEERIRPDHVIGTGIRMQSFKVGPGHVSTPKRGHLYIGHASGNRTLQLKTVHALLDAVIPTEITDNILGVLWSKLTFTCLGFFGSLADQPLKAICETEGNRRLCVEFLGEVVRVGVAVGMRFIPLTEYDPRAFHPDLPLESRMVALKEMIAEHWKSESRPGQLLQLIRHVKTEVDYTVAEVVREGCRAGVATPLCQALVNIFHEIEEGKRPLTLQNYSDLAAVG